MWVAKRFFGARFLTGASRKEGDLDAAIIFVGFKMHSGRRASLWGEVHLADLDSDDRLTAVEDGEARLRAVG